MAVNNNYYTPLPIIIASKQQATSNKQATSTSQKQKSQGSGSGSGSSPKLWPHVPPPVPCPEPEFWAKTIRQAPGVAPAQGGGGGSWAGPKRGRNSPKTAKNGQNRPETARTAPRGPRSGSVTLCSLFGANGRDFGDGSDPLRPLGPLFGSVLGCFGPDAWRPRRAGRQNRKLAVSRAGWPESRFWGHFSRVQPPSLGGFHPSERPQRPRRTPYRARQGGGGGGGQNATTRDPRKVNFGPKSGQKQLCPKMIPATLGRCTGHI